MSSIEKGKQEAYWRSLNELADTPEFRQFVEKEFPSQKPLLDNPVSRRNFLRYMGASMAMAGVTACRWPREEILPFASRPEGRTPGVPVSYATAMEIGGAAMGLLVTSYDGRPIKIEGNPLHPGSLGATNAFAQASILELYDPDRIRWVREKVGNEYLNKKWDDFERFAAEHFTNLRGRSGQGLHILSESSASETLRRLRGRLRQAMPQARWHEWEPLTDDNVREGARIAFGRPLRTHMHLENADVIVCLDADLLMTHPNAVRHARDYASRRNPDRSMNRLYVVESTLSVTGSSADHRLAVKPSEVGAIARQILEGLDGAAVTGAESRKAFVEALVKDLKAHAGRGVVTAGPGQPAAVHAVVHLINEKLGNVGLVGQKTVAYTIDPADADDERPSHAASLRDLTDALIQGRVGTLVILGGNPVFDAPADLGFADALAKAETVIHLSLYENETSTRCRWVLPRSHFLESWGDTAAWNGDISVVQPLIEPLHLGRSPIELLALISGDSVTTGYDLVRRTMDVSGPRAEETWRALLHDGVRQESALRPERPAVIAPAVLSAASALAGGEGLEIQFIPDAHVWDGRFANNGWLQEMPDPLTKLTWDNAAILGPKTANQLNLRHGDLARIEQGGRSLEIAVYVLPGVAEETVVVSLGYGRTKAGQIGEGTGFNVYALRQSGGLYTASGAAVSRTGRTYPLACTQDHFAIDKVGQKATQARLHELVRQASWDNYRDHPDFAQHVVHHPPLESLWNERAVAPYDGYKWGMTVDLNACIGCGSCVIACQAENNVPVVGKDEVSRSREMHWLRIDRYFKGDPEDPDVAHQPVACQHCENAPCEQVCPVAATVHDHEGLNVMVYNRCIGTRYCSNNCPYKVRRFNWFSNLDSIRQTETMQKNPEVTVRSRGVMEKCTFCVQRINAAKIPAKNEGRAVRDGEIVPACAQSCPTQAIRFGDLNDPASAVAQSYHHQRAYGMLAELNVKPRTHYLAKVTNPSPALHSEAPHGGGDSHHGRATHPTDEGHG